MGDPYLAYKRAKFATRLPTDRLFTQGHFWLAEDADGAFRVGFTKFATRMLGEVVEFDFEAAPGSSIEVGQPIGWVEGFKAVTDLYAPLAGRFVGTNPDLEEAVDQVHKSPYEFGWLYRIEGTPPDDALDASDYASFLDATIDRMMGNTT